MKKFRDGWNAFLNTLARKGVGFGVLLGLLPAVLIVYCGYVLAIEPTITANRDKTKSVESIEAEVARGIAVERSEKEFKQEFTRVVELFYDSLPLLPKETELSNVMTGVQEAASRYKVTVTNLSAIKDAVKTVNADKLYEREIPSTVVGNYDDVMRFFMDVSRMTRILIIRDFDVSSVKETQGSVRPTAVAVQFNLLAFHAPPTSEFPVLPPDINPVKRAETAAIDGKPTGQ